MKNYILLFLVGFLIFLCSCYEDKGNYSYGEINEMTLSFLPVTTNSDKNVYILPQPNDDTLLYELTPIVEQTLNVKEENLEYRWQLLKGKVNNVEIFDTIYSKSYVFKFAPGVSTVYDVLFSVKDWSTEVECYRRLKLRTIVPFIRNWLILHGKEGDRKIAALEYDSAGINLVRRVEDIYQEEKKTWNCRNAFAMCYLSDAYPKAPNDRDRLYLLEPEDCYWVYPFACEERDKTRGMMPDGWSGQFKSCVSASPNECAGIVDQEGNYFHCGAMGFFYKAKYKDGIIGARVDEAYISYNRYVTLWDNTNKKLMYYKILPDLYEGRGNVRQSESVFDERMQIGVFPDSMMREMDKPEIELMWLGHGVSNSASNGASAIFHNTLTGEYNLLNVGYEKTTVNGITVFVITDIHSLKNADFGENSQFAVTTAFSEQIFYSLGNNIYLYNTINGYSGFLYSVGEGNKITKLAFRMENQGTIEQDFGAVKILGVGVETGNGAGEFHELFFDESGDIVRYEVYRGLGPVVDFCYSYLEHIFE